MTKKVFYPLQESIHALLKKGDKKLAAWIADPKILD
jgi:hypothetical protein